MALTRESLEKVAKIVVEQSIAIRETEFQKEVLASHP
jgi:hypothetical protein